LHSRTKGEDVTGNGWTTSPNGMDRKGWKSLVKMALDDDGDDDDDDNNESQLPHLGTDKTHAM